ncbi:ThiF family adenylyltransferase [Candidatus Woesearchaeota archaeon]|nr:ThiF family adenylyltransferase [Candidatus Woesearchaeota archaeon]
MSLDLVRAQALWGSQGQEVLKNGSVAINGLNNLGIEIIKSLVTLGIDNIYLFDNIRNERNQKFLDKDMKKGISTAKTLEIMIKECFKEDCNIIHYHTLANKTFYDLKPIDVIVDCSNNPYNHLMNLEYVNEKKIALFTVCANKQEGEISFYSPNHENDCQPILEDYFENEPGVIISNLLCGITVEEVRKYLFKHNIEKFTNPILREINDPQRIQANNGLEFEKHDYKETINKDKLLRRNFYHNLKAEDIFQRMEKSSIVQFANNEFRINNKRILVLGAGAIGNYCTLMLSHFSNNEIDFVDFDCYKKHNIARQYLAYDSYDKINEDYFNLKYAKSKVLSEKLKIINPNIKTQGIIGFVGEEYNKSLLKSHKLKESDVTLVNRGWINNNYDIILGCFDNFTARYESAKMAFDLKIPYLDGGSSADPTSSSLITYIPWINDEDISQNFINREDKDSIRREKWQRYRNNMNSNLNENDEVFIQGQSCSDFKSGSVSMGNQIAAALMINEMRKVLRPEVYGELIIRRGNYNSNLSKRLSME